MIISRYYKPEVLVCPKCGSKLVYRYAVSNKLIYFSSGKQIQIHNLGYGCKECKDNQIYFSQTANKLALKGYTYSTKIICIIAMLKERQLSREEICDYFFSKNIEISDRNVDNLYRKYKQCIKINHKELIPKAYKRMLEEYGQIRLSIDLITAFGKAFVVVYDFFTSEILAFVCFEGVEDTKLYDFLQEYIKKDMNITVITSIRKDANFIPMLKNLSPAKTKFIAYGKL